MASSVTNSSPVQTYSALDDVMSQCNDRNDVPSYSIIIQSFSIDHFCNLYQDTKNDCLAARVFFLSLSGILNLAITSHLPAFHALGAVASLVYSLGLTVFAAIDYKHAGRHLRNAASQLKYVFISIALIPLGAPLMPFAIGYYIHKNNCAKS